MSTQEQEVGQGESRSSVKLTRNAKGDTQIDVKVYVGDSEHDIDDAKAKAIEVYNSLAAEYGSGS